jgi:hypothetical protein
MDPLTYQLLSWLAAGNRVFRPRDATAKAQVEFREVVESLGRLRDRGWVTYLSGHISETSSGTYLAVGPVHLTPDGESALLRDRRLGARPAWPGTLPWPG